MEDSARGPMSRQVVAVVVAIIFLAAALFINKLELNMCKNAIGQLKSHSTTTDKAK